LIVAVTVTTRAGQNTAPRKSGGNWHFRQQILQADFLGQSVDAADDAVV